MVTCKTVFALAGEALLCPVVQDKCALVDALSESWNRDELAISDDELPEAISQPGRPPRPVLVHPSKLSRRSLHTEQGRLALMHAIAHIEFNAINLACDAVYRFRGMPEQYYADWIRIAVEETRHFKLLLAYLAGYGVCYGDYPAHNGLWDMAVKTADDVLLRMVLVPRVLEARGLDVTPLMIEGFRQAGDEDAVRILDTIYREEIGHVAAGSRWFQYLCKQRGLDHVEQFCQLVGNYAKGSLRGPFNLDARKEAGFTEAELEYIQA